VAGLLLGILIKYTSIFTIEDFTILSFLANLGIILLFYYVGLETNFASFKRNFQKSVFVSIFNTSIPFIISFAIMNYFYKFDDLSSAIVGISLAVSAHAVSADILEEMNQLHSHIGNLIISAGAVDDIIELILITILLSFFHFSINNMTVSKLIFDVIVFMLFIVFARLWLIPVILEFMDREKSSTSRFMISMIIVFIIASLTESLGNGSLIGALVAGMIVRQTIFREDDIPNWEKHDITRPVHIISFGLLIPLFFVFVGLNTDLGVITSNYWMIIIFIAIAIIGTVGGTIIGLMLSKGSLKDGFILGWGLNPKGDVELVIATLALKAGVISQVIFTSLVIVTLATTIISPIIFRKLVANYN